MGRRTVQMPLGSSRLISIMYKTPVSTIRNFGLHYKNQAVNAVYRNNLCCENHTKHINTTFDKIYGFFYVKAVVPIVLTAFKRFN